MSDNTRNIQAEFIRSVREQHKRDADLKAQNWPGKTDPDEYFQQREALLDIIDAKNEEIAEVEERRKEAVAQATTISRANDSVEEERNRLRHLIAEIKAKVDEL